MAPTRAAGEEVFHLQMVPVTELKFDAHTVLHLHQ